MRVVLQGSLQHFSARELLRLLSDGSHTGTFDAEASAGRLRLTIQGGLLAGAEATGSSEPATVIGMLLEWKDGVFNFLDGVALPEGAVPLGLEIGGVIAEAEKRAEEKQKILDLYPDDSIVFPVVNQPEGDISLKPIEFKILLHFAGGRSLAQLLSALKMPAVDLYPIVKHLQTTGLLAGGNFDPEATSVTPMEVPFIKPEAAEAKGKGAAPKPMAAKPAAPPEQRPRTVETPNPAEATIIQPRHPEAEPRAPQPKPSEPVKPKAESRPAEAKGEATRPATPKAESTPWQEQAVKGAKPLLVAMLTSDDGTSYPLLEEISTIGRIEPSDVVLPDGSISTKHARILRGAEGFMIEDLGSRNGTFVNSEKVTEKRALADGDIVRLGKVILTFNVAKEADVKDVTQPDIKK